MMNGFTRKIRLQALALLAVLLGGQAVEAGTSVRVRTVVYKGWENSVELVNADQTRLVVVPAIGRIMYYGLAGGENILWDDPQHYGKRLPAGEPYKGEDGQYLWTNYGGDKVWPNQQSEWERINGRAWPPDQWFDGGEHEVELLQDGVVITSPVSRYNGARIVRRIRLAPRGARVEIHQRLEKVARAAREELEPLRYTIWNVTQIRPPEQTLYPLNPHSHFARRFHVFAAGANDEEKASKEQRVLSHFSVEGDVGIFVPDAEQSQKSGADADRWLAGIVGHTLMAEFFRRDGTRHYPDGGLSAEVYTSPEYTELELLGPWVRLAVGEVLEFDIAWELQRLPEGAAPAQRRRAALQWLRERR